MFCETAGAAMTHDGVVDDEDDQKNVHCVTSCCVLRIISCGMHAGG